MRATPDIIKEQAIALRKEGRLSLGDIAKHLNIGRTTVARIVKDYPLSLSEQRESRALKLRGKRRLAFDLVGQRFGRLIAIRPDYTPRKKHDTYWLCVCDCSKQHMVSSYHLRHGIARSCGCLSRDVARERQQKAPKLVNVHSLYLSYKKGAEARGIQFELTEDDCLMLFEQDCYYCGSPPSRERKVHKNQDVPGRKKGFIYNGIDRCDSSLGYNLINCVPCCSFCNYAKRDDEEDAFIAWLDRVAAYRLGKREV